jgi:hypothetical protein
MVKENDLHSTIYFLSACVCNAVAFDLDALHCDAAQT